jgi:GT2 family glycosyltransferase
VSSASRIQISVLSYNRLDCLPRLFDELLLPASRQGVQVTVVDNASEQKVRDYLLQFVGAPHFDILLNRDNCGVAMGRNAGFRRSDREFLVYLDDDALMALEDILRVPNLFDEIPDAGVLAFRVVHGVTGVPQNDHGGDRQRVGNFHGAGHAIRRAVLERIGYLDETCFFGAEEVEFTMRALSTGMKTVFTPELLVRHFNFARSGKERLQRRIEWARNYSMVLFRYLPPATASLFGLRLLASHTFSDLRAIKLGAVMLPSAMLHGAIRGLSSQNRLAPEYVAFYSDPATRPEIGNVSISSKILRRLFESNSR